jgi:hypothetical protein
VAWALWTLTLLGLAATARFDQLLRQAGRPELVQLDAGGVAVILSAVSAATAGAVLASHRPRHPVGWLLLAFGLVPQALSYAAEGYARYGLLARPGDAAVGRAAGHAGSATRPSRSPWSWRPRRWCGASAAAAAANASNFAGWRWRPLWRRWWSW